MSRSVNFSEMRVVKLLESSIPRIKSRSAVAAIALLVLTASAIPINVGGWGPREAASGAVFALAGIGGAAGVEVSTAYGVLALIAVAPGGLVLLTDRIRARRERRLA